MAFEGLIALAALLHIPSEAGASLLFGFSLSRLALAGAALVGVALLATAALAEWRKATEAAYPTMRGKLVPADLFDEVRRLRDEYRAKGGK